MFLGYLKLVRVSVLENKCNESSNFPLKDRNWVSLSLLSVYDVHS
jgi:hypothetical protein